jgi:hypothetical protein
MCVYKVQLVINEVENVCTGFKIKTGLNGKMRKFILCVALNLFSRFLADF